MIFRNSCCKHLLLLLLFIPVHGFSQFQEDFSDGNIVENPQWIGDIVKFEVDTSLRLHLNAPAETTTAFLATPCEVIQNASWEFRVMLDFNPSSSNYARIYLVSDVPDVSGNLNGYFVMVGNTADEVSLYKQQGANIVQIIDGKDKRLDATNINVRIKVERDNTGIWKLYSDTTGGDSFYLEGEGVDHTIQRSTFFGVFCSYSSTRADKFYFDDLMVTGEPFMDTIPPEVDSVTFFPPNEVLVLFSEALDTLAALGTTNYLLDNHMYFPGKIEFREDNHSVLLEYEVPFANKMLYQLDVSSVKDTSGNVMRDTSFTFFSYTPELNDIVVTEIMADPFPSQGLPECEFIELYNRNPFDIALKNWVLEVGSNDVSLPDFFIQSNSYLIVCSQDVREELEPYGKVLGLGALPALRNSGQSIYLKAPGGEIIARENYDISWYHDENKADGGWSLEKKDPDNFCGGGNNWMASVSDEGGTPGKVNSVDGPNMDFLAPYLLNWEMLNEKEICLFFSEPLADSVVKKENFLFTVGVNSMDSVFFNKPANDQVLLVLKDSIKPDIDYTLNIHHINDLCGNVLSDEAIPIFYHEVHAHEVLISEIMPDPVPSAGLPEQEYIEIFNSSDYTISLEQLFLHVGEWVIPLPDSIFKKNDYLILCNNDASEDYRSFGKTAVVKNLPVLPNGEGNIWLSSTKNRVIHYVSYNDSYFPDNFKKDGGWSLEIADLENVCNGKGNWHVSEDLKGGTPGRENSVMAKNPDVIPPEILMAFIHEGHFVTVIFSETMDTFSLRDIKHYQIRQMGPPENMFLGYPEYKQVTLQFNGSFLHGEKYHLEVSDIPDCAGNFLEEKEYMLAVPQRIDPGDVLINEVLFDPYAGGAEFIELYNHSSKVLSLDQLLLEVTNPESVSITGLYPVCGNRFLFFPGDFIVITKSKEEIFPYYHTENKKNFMDMDNFPLLSNEQSILSLRDTSNRLIDVLHYQKDWHHKLLQDTKGVSLERIYYDRSTQSEMNWHSASETCGFATPGYRNSQAQEISESSEIHMEHEMFSPDNDGYQDFLSVSYQFEEPGNALNAWIFSPEGMKIRQLANNELLGTTGTFVWDGIMEGGKKAPTGIYIVYIEVFHLDGTVRTYKKTCVLARKF